LHRGDYGLRRVGKELDYLAFIVRLGVGFDRLGDFRHVVTLPPAPRRMIRPIAASLCFDFYMIEAKPENLIGDRA
jgi:hypothetical protein